MYIYTYICTCICIYLYVCVLESDICMMFVEANSSIAGQEGSEAPLPFNSVTPSHLVETDLDEDDYPTEVPCAIVFIEHVHVYSITQYILLYRTLHLPGNNVK